MKDLTYDISGMSTGDNIVTSSKKLKTWCHIEAALRLFFACSLAWAWLWLVETKQKEKINIRQWTRWRGLPWAQLVNISCHQIFTLMIFTGHGCWQELPKSASSSPLSSAPNEHVSRRGLWCYGLHPPRVKSPAHSPSQTQPSAPLDHQLRPGSPANPRPRHSSLPHSTLVSSQRCGCLAVRATFGWIDGWMDRCVCMDGVKSTA